MSASKDCSAETVESQIRALARDPALRRVVLNVNCRLDAEDLSQQALVVVWQKRASLSDWRTVRGFAKATAHRLALNAARLAGFKNCAGEPGSDAPDQRRNASAELEARDLLVWLQQVVVDLPQSQRSAFDLVVLEEVGNEEAAQALGVTPEALRKRLHDARKWFEDRLRKDGLNKEEVLRSYRAWLPPIGAVPSDIFPDRKPGQAPPLKNEPGSPLPRRGPGVVPLVIGGLCVLSALGLVEAFQHCAQSGATRPSTAASAPAPQASRGWLLFEPRSGVASGLWESSPGNGSSPTGWARGVESSLNPQGSADPARGSGAQPTAAGDACGDPAIPETREAVLAGARACFSTGTRTFSEWSISLQEGYVQVTPLADGGQDRSGNSRVYVEEKECGIRLRAREENWRCARLQGFIDLAVWLGGSGRALQEASKELRRWTFVFGVSTKGVGVFPDDAAIVCSQPTTRSRRLFLVPPLRRRDDSEVTILVEQRNPGDLEIVGFGPHGPIAHSHEGAWFQVKFRERGYSVNTLNDRMGIEYPLIAGKDADAGSGPACYVQTPQVAPERYNLARPRE